MFYTDTEEKHNIKATYNGVFFLSDHGLTVRNSLFYSHITDNMYLVHQCQRNIQFASSKISHLSWVHRDLTYVINYFMSKGLWFPHFLISHHACSSQCVLYKCMYNVGGESVIEDMYFFYNRATLELSLLMAYHFIYNH